MKRDDLIKALKTTKGKIKVGWRLTPELHIAPNVEKMSVVEELMIALPTNVETGLYINDGGYLTKESDRP